MKLVIAEKPSVAQSIAKVIGAASRKDGYLEGNGYIVSWCIGHLVELAEPETYDEKYKKWTYEDLPIMPNKWKYEVSSAIFCDKKTVYCIEKSDKARRCCQSCLCNGRRA